MADEVVSYLRELARAENWSAQADWARAAPAWERVTATNPVNGSYWARLAEARFALGDYAAAIGSCQQVLRLGAWWPGSGPDGEPFLLPAEVTYRIACCHARLGDGERAIATLRDAIDQGFRDLDRAREDESWASLRDDQRVGDLLGIVEPDSGSRADRWRADIQFLMREITRRAYAPFASIPAAELSRQADELARQVPGLSDAQLIAGMLRLIRHLDDGHAWIQPPEADQDLNRELPLEFFDFAEGVFIIAAAPEHRRLVGARVEAVGGHPMTEVMAALDEVISRDNHQQFRFAAARWLRWAPILHALGLTSEPGQASFSLVLTDGKREQATVPAVPRDPDFPGTAYPYPAGWVSLPDTLDTPPPLHLRHRELPYWFDYLPAADLVYFQFNAVRDHPAEPFAQFCDRLFAFIDARRPGRLVIDIRWNGGGNTTLVGPLLRHLALRPQISRRGGLYVITGRLTFSAAQNTVTMLEGQFQPVFVGEPTGSRPNFIGEVVAFELPYSRVRVNVSDLYWQMSWSTDHRTWIAPQIYAPVTFAAFSENRDPALEAILASHDHLPGI